MIRCWRDMRTGGSCGGMGQWCRMRSMRIRLRTMRLRLRWWGSDGESVVPVGGEDCGARDAVVAREILFCNPFGCNWSGGADGRARVQRVVSRDAAAAGAEH